MREEQQLPASAAREDGVWESGNHKVNLSQSIDLSEGIVEDSHNNISCHSHTIMYVSMFRFAW